MTRSGDIQKLIDAAIDQEFPVDDQGAKWVVYSKDGLRSQTIHKPHKKAGHPGAVRSQLRRLGVKV